MAQDITEIFRGIVGRKKVVYLAFDANGTAAGAYDVGLEVVDAVFSQNSENNSESFKVVKNSDDDTEGTANGSIYITVPDGTNNTGYIEVIGHD